MMKRTARRAKASPSRRFYFIEQNAHRASASSVFSAGLFA
jgi:hypothetical protein